MASFDPSKSIILCTEASFNEGLSAALIQKTDRGIQPVHFISRRMTDTEKEAKVPPRIEKWIMEMQDVDDELVHEPGKVEADPLDYLSRHPLPETGDDKAEKIIRWNVNAEHAVVVTRIRKGNPER
ncbi:hypothetical protein ACROYT_G018724 [Oculina patagonica]